MSIRGNRKKMVGRVISDKMQKTVVVEIERRVIEPRYKKIVIKKNRFKAHDEKNEYKMGDKVLLMETRPLSHDKRWRVVELIEKTKDLKKDISSSEEESETI